MNHKRPVRPSSVCFCCPTLSLGKAEELSGLVCGECVDEDVDHKLALLKDPIVGIDKTILDANGPGALDPKLLTTPPTMTKAQWEKHKVTHLPHHPGCPICRATRTPIVPHHLTHEAERTIPMLVADYCFLRFMEDTSAPPTRVMRL